MEKVDSKITLEQIHDLLDLAEKEKLDRRLGYVYEQVPANDCQRCTDCCFNVAQVYPVEFLNIFRQLRGLSELAQVRLGRRLAEYELLHLTTLDLKCPFLEEIDCAVYETRALQCRVFGLYPRHEYEGMVEQSRDANEQLAMYYARNKRLLLPEEVMTYDVDQCENNIDDGGNTVVLAGRERSHLHQQLYSMGEQILPPEWISENQVGFSTQYLQLFFDAEEVEDMRVAVIKEYQAGRTRSKLDRILSQTKFHF